MSTTREAMSATLESGNSQRRFEVFMRTLLTGTEAQVSRSYPSTEGSGWLSDLTSTPPNSLHPVTTALRLPVWVKLHGGRDRSQNVAAGFQAGNDRSHRFLL